MIYTFLSSNTPLMKMLRTMVQALIGILNSNIDYLVGLHFSGTTKAIIVGVTMAILSPIMALIAEYNKDDSNE